MRISAADSIGVTSALLFLVLWGQLQVNLVVSFLPRPKTKAPFRSPSGHVHNENTEFLLFSTLADKEPSSPVYDAPFQASTLQDLFEAAEQASIPKSEDGVTGQFDNKFRYEWGNWVQDDKVSNVMELMNDIRLTPGVYDTFVPTSDDDNDNDSAPQEPRRLRVAGGDHWDCILHILPPDSEWSGRWPTGSWAMVRALTGVAEVSQLRGPNRDGFYTKAVKKNLRGGGDGTLAGGNAASGEDCVKYVGGALRSYGGKSGKTALLEIVVRPPVGKEQVDGDGQETGTIEVLSNPDDVLDVFIPPEEAEEIDNDEGESDEVEDDQPGHLGSKLGMTFDKVGGLDEQLNAIVRRVLASRSNPEAAKRLGVSHVRGILLSGPPGCGKTLLARELSRMLGAREPQIVNGPEILDKFVGEAEKNVRALFRPAEIEYAQAGDASALHVIILDEMDAIARKRGSITGDSTGVRDSVVNQLLAKMDGVKEASNVLVVGLTNRPELLDPALLRPGRLEVQLRVELPDLAGRRDILRIHTRRMREAGGISKESNTFIENLEEDGLPARTEHFTGAELAGLVRSAASFALARTVEGDGSISDSASAGIVTVDDLNRALSEVRPALGKQDEVLEARYPYGISPCSKSMERMMRDLQRFTSSPTISSSVENLKPQMASMLVVGGGGKGGTGASALACWAAADASERGEADYVRLLTSLDLLADGGSDEASRAAVLMTKFTEAGEMPSSLLVLDDIDQLCAGSGPGGYSSIMLATLRALLRTPPSSTTTAKAGGHSMARNNKDGKQRPKSLRVIATTSRSDAACVTLHELFDETLVVSELENAESVSKLLKDISEQSGLSIFHPTEMADRIISRLGRIGCKSALRLAERSVAIAGDGDGRNEVGEAQLEALDTILEDLAVDEGVAGAMCEVI